MTLKPPVSPNASLGDGRVLINAVSDHGARGNGTTDDSVAIAAAISHAATVATSSMYGGIVYLPQGNYATASTINVPDGVRLLGAGPTATRITALAGLGSNPVIQNSVQTGAQEFAWIEGIEIHGNNIASVGVYLKNIFTTSWIRNVWVTACVNGIKCEATVSSGPIALEDVVSVTHSGDCILISGTWVGVWGHHITAEGPGNGFACVKVAGGADPVFGASIDGLHVENQRAATSVIGLLIDKVTGFHARNIFGLGYGAGAITDLVKIQNASKGITVEKIGGSSTTNLVNDVVNTITVVNNSDFYLTRYESDAPNVVKTPTFATAGWVNRGGGFRPAHYVKDASGAIHIEGACKTTNGTAVDGTTIFTLPTGYRPATLVYVTAFRSDTGAALQVAIDNGGNVVVTAALPAATIVDLIAPPFRTDI